MNSRDSDSESQSGPESIAALSLDLADERAWLGGEPLRLTPKTFATLRTLVAHRGRLVTKSELLSDVWPGTAVSESVLTTTIHELRRALGERSRGASYIQTVHGRGYRFVGPLGPEDSSAPGVRASASRPAAWPPFVGREADLERCARWLRMVAEGRRRVAFITGEAGVGKTAVLDEFLLRTRAAQAARIVRGRCVESYGSFEAYRPWLEAISQLCRDPEAGAGVVDVLRRVAPMWLAQLPAFVSVEERRALLSEVSSSAPERMLREMADALDLLAADRPLVVALEDLHWGDRPSLELLSLVAQRPDPARLLVIGTLRPMELNLSGRSLEPIQQELAFRGHCEELNLEFLSEAAVVRYAQTLLPGLPEEVGPLVHRRTDGNALFMVNTLDYLVRCGLLVEREGRWSAPQGLRAIETAVPESLRTMIERQLGRLEAEDRRLLEVASVAGVEFADATLAAALGRSVEEVSARCRALATRGAFLRIGSEEDWPDGTATQRYAFLHALYREVLYAASSPSTRIRLHRAIGERLESGFGDRSGELAAELASHFERSRDVPRAVSYLAISARNAGQRLAYLETTRDLAKALELLESLPDDPARQRRELTLRMALAPALVMTAGYAAPEAEEAYARAEDLCRRVGDERQFFTVLIGRSAPSLLRARTDVAKALATESLRIAKSWQSPQYLSQAEMALGVTLVWRGEFGPAAAHLTASLDAYDSVARRPATFRLIHDSGATSRAYLAWALWMLGSPDRARQESDRAIAAARELSHPFSLTVALAFAAFVHHACRDVAATRERAEACISVATEHNFPMYQAVGRMFRGWALGEQGRLEDASRVLEKGLAAFGATGAILVRPFYFSMIAEACARRGDLMRARSLVEEAISIAEDSGERLHLADLHRRLGDLIARDPASARHAGRVRSEVERQYRQALQVAREQEALVFELRAVTSLARWWRRENRIEEADELLRSCYSRFTEGFDTADLREAADLLDELAQDSRATASEQ